MLNILLGLVTQSSDDLATGWLFPFMVLVLVLFLSIISLMVPLVGFASIILGLGVGVPIVISSGSDVFRMFAVSVVFIAVLFMLLGRRVHNKGSG